MQLPIVAPAPIVTAHADIFRDLFENRCQFHHFQHYLTGLIVLDNKSLANITRCVLESAGSGKCLSRNTCPIVPSQQRRKNEHASIRKWIPSCWTIQTFRSSTTNFVRKSTSASSYWTRRFSTKYPLGSSCLTVGISRKNWCPWRATGKKTGSVC